MFDELELLSLSASMQEEGRTVRDSSNCYEVIVSLSSFISVQYKREINVLCATPKHIQVK